MLKVIIEHKCFICVLISYDYGIDLCLKGLVSCIFLYLYSQPNFQVGSKHSSVELYLYFIKYIFVDGRNNFILKTCYSSELKLMMALLLNF